MAQVVGQWQKSTCSKVAEWVEFGVIRGRFYAFCEYIEPIF